MTKSENISLLDRELSVLGPGFADGIRKSIDQTGDDLAHFRDEFLANPLTATGTYVKDHAADLLVGAAIQFANPSGKTAALLAAWSMRGVATSTVEAALAAAKPTADLDAIRSQYSTAISHEGTAILGSLPMTFVGGIAGRGLATGTFGPKMGAIDYLRGDVTTSQVRANLLNMKDGIFAPQKKVLVTDLDGTTFPIYDYLVPALQENIKFISKQMAIPESEVSSALGGQRVHPWILETSPLAQKFKGTALEFETQVVKPFWEIFNRNRAERLSAFPEVANTLAKAKAEGVQVVALTNAPTPLALQRMEVAGLTGYVDRLYSVHPVEPSLTQVVSPSALEFGRNIVQSELGKVKTTPQLHELPRTASKPDTGGMDMIMRDLGVRPREMLFVGDSLFKDGLVGEARGIPFVWAKYGAEHPQSYKLFLDNLGRPADPAGKVRAPEAASTPTPPPTVRNIAGYEEVLPFLRPYIDWQNIGQGLLAQARRTPSFQPVVNYNLIPQESDQRRY